MKKYTQTGTLSIALFAPLIVIFLFQFYRTTNGSLEGASTTLLIVILILILCLLFFYKQTIYIDETSISFKFGIGWFGRTYKFSEIESCEPVRNRWTYGIGIRWIGSGWLYNVSGVKAIELKFKNKDSVVRIGTNKPREIVNLVRERLENN